MPVNSNFRWESCPASRHNGGMTGAAQRVDSGNALFGEGVRQILAVRAAACL
jgi:hypothetical protein